MYTVNLDSFLVLNLKYYLVETFKLYSSKLTLRCLDVKIYMA